MQDLSNLNVCLAVNDYGAGRVIGGPAFSQIDTTVALLASGARLDVVTGLAPRLPSWVSRYTSRMPVWHELLRGQPSSDAAGSWGAVRRCAAKFRHARFLRGVRRLRPDILWVEGFPTHRFLEGLRDWQPRHRLINIRGSPDQLSGRFMGVNHLERVLQELSLYDGFVNVSSRVAAMWQALPALAGKRVFHLPNCAREEDAADLRAETRAAVRQRLGLPVDRLIGVTVASVQTRKGQQFVAEAYPEISRALPDLLLLMVGVVLEQGGGPDIVAAFGRQGAGDRVVFTGHSDRALDYLYAADFLLLPSLEEAMPLSVLEAMALGTPVAASTAGGIPELIEHERHGLLFKPGSADEVAVAVIRMGSDAAARLRWAEAAEERYRVEFCRARQFERYRLVLEELARS